MAVTLGAPVIVSVWTVPSPQLTVMLFTVPSGSVAVMVSVIIWPVVAVVADSVNVTVGGLSVIVLVAFVLLVVRPELSVALTYTWYVFAVAYAWLSVVAVPASVSTVPSPHDTLSELTVPSGSAAVMVRVMVVPGVVAVVDSVNDTVGARSLIVLVAVALLVMDPLLSVAFT